MEATSQAEQKLAPEVKKAFDDFLMQAKAVQKSVQDAASSK